MFRVVIAYALFISGTYSQSKLWYDKFIKYIDRPDGLSVSIVIHQKQFESSVIDTGLIEIKDSDKYILDFSDETVHVDNDIIKTWNKKDSQLIIDRRIKGDIAIFDLFNKDFKEMTLGATTIQNEIIMIDFNISKMGYKGTLSMLKSGEPKEIKIIYGPEQSVSLEVNKLKIGGLTLYNSFNPQNVEIKDLRE